MKGESLWKTHLETDSGPFPLTFNFLGHRLHIYEGGGKENFFGKAMIGCRKQGFPWDRPPPDRLAFARNLVTAIDGGCSWF